MNFDYSLSTKWLALLKQIAPDLTRVAVLRNIEYAGNIGAQFKPRRHRWGWS